MIGLFFLIFIVFALLVIYTIQNTISLRNLKERVRYLEIELKKYYSQTRPVHFQNVAVPKEQAASVIVPEVIEEVKPAPQNDLINEIKIKENVEINEIIDTEKPQIIEPISQDIIENEIPQPIKYQSEKKEEPKFEYKEKYEAPKPRTIQEFENLIGGRILNRIGSAALIIGIGFFLKYAFDNNWITETMRIVIGFVIGFGLIGLGERYIKKDYQIFSHGLFGSGLAILYLTVFSAYNFYHLFPQPVAFVAMTFVTGFSYFIALRHDSQSISWIASLGGYLTPVLIRSNDTNVIALTIFLTILNINQILQIKYKPSWQKLIYLSFVMSYFYLYSLVDGFNDNSLNYYQGIIFLFVNFAVFYYYELQYKNLINTLVGVANLIVVNLGIITIILDRINKNSTSLILFYLLLLMIVNLSQLAFLNKKYKWQGEFLISFLFSWLHFFLIFAQTLSLFTDPKLSSHFEIFVPFTVWIFFFISEFYLLKNFREEIKKFILWLSILNAGLVYIGLNMTMTGYYYKWKPLVVLILAIIYFVPFAFRQAKDFISEDGITTYLLTSFVMLLFATYLYFDGYYISLLWIIEITIISSILYKSKNYLAFTYFKFTILIPLVYMVYANYLVGLKDSIYIFTPLFNPRFLVFALLTGSIFASIRLHLPTGEKKYYLSEWIDDINNIFEILFVILLSITFLNEFNELTYYFDYKQIFNSNWFDSLFNFIRAEYFLLIAYLLFVRNLILNKSIKIASIIALSVISTLYLITLFSFDNDLFSPYINLRMGFFTFSLFIIIHQIKLCKQQFGNNIELFFRIVLTVLAFTFITSEVRNYFHNAGTYSKILSEQKELATSVAWIFLSLIYFGIGIWKKIRVYRFISIILFGISILKVFLFDLSNLETIYRIISFIFLGAILILISFLYQKYKDVILMVEDKK